MKAFPVNAAHPIQRALSKRSARVTLIVITSVAYALAYLPLRIRLGAPAGLFAIAPVTLCG